jgi:hypothetical protein
MYVNEWIRYECSDEGRSTQNIHTHLLVHMHQKTKIAAKKTRIDRDETTSKIQGEFRRFERRRDVI